jgi:hypothetical protein
MSKRKQTLSPASVIGRNAAAGPDQAPSAELPSPAESIHLGDDIHHLEPNTESGPPDPDELGEEHGQQSASVPAERLQATSGEPAAPAPAAQDVKDVGAQCVTPSAPDCSAIVANLDRQSAPAWPAASPFQVDWPWGAEPDPVPGDIVGWNWQRKEIAVVTAIPPVMEQYPYTLTCAIRKMPESEGAGHVRILELNKGGEIKDLCWYTRWNRAYARKEAPGSGWLGVVRES